MTALYGTRSKLRNYKTN